MSIDNSTYDRIDDYLSGKMSDDVLTRFEGDMASDINLANEVNAMRFANESLLDYKIASIYNLMEARNPYLKDSGQTNFGNSKTLKWVGGALIATGLIVGGHYISKDKEIDSNPTEILSKDKNVFVEPAQNGLIGDSSDNTNLIGSQSSQKSGSNNYAKLDEVEVDEEKINEIRHNEVVLAKGDSINVEKPDSVIVLPIDLCDGINIKAEPLPVKTCIGRSEGEIFIPRTKINGGTFPYEFSLNDRDHYSNKNSFSNLDIGEYRVFVRDANGCQSVPSLVTIEGKRCDELEVESFNPTIALWEFPVDDFEYCQIEVVNVSGRMVYKIRMDGDEAPRWDGKSLSGSDLASDIYVYQIKYDDGRLEKGYINLVR